MIVQELISERLVLHYSDLGVLIKKQGTEELYESAVDVIPCAFVYEETDIPIPAPEEPEEEYPAWDVHASQVFEIGDRVKCEGVVYECIKAHSAAWNKQPPNAEYWREVEHA